MVNAEMVGDYSAAELNAMSKEEMQRAAAQQFRKPVDAADAPVPVETVPDDPTPAPQPSGDVWATRKAGKAVFVLPSGQTCRLRELTPDELLMSGILDKVTRLEGLADELVKKAQGEPPAKQRMPTREEFAQLLETINIIVPLAVAEPKVWAEPVDGTYLAERIYAGDISLDDRMAIVEESLKGIRSLDRFRIPR